MESEFKGPFRATVAMIAVVSSLIFANAAFVDQGAMASPDAIVIATGNSRHF